MTNELDYQAIQLPKSKEDALKRGYSYYYTGKPCVNYGHYSVRRVENSVCLDCEIEERG